MQLQFTKMHGTGNDFVVIDLISQHYKLRAQDVRRLADRHYGVGCDQVLVVEAPKNPNVDFRYRIYNADGEEVEQCGNGARCFARFVRDKKLTGKRVIKVETSAGVIELRVHANHEVEVNMGSPEFEPSKIPMVASARAQSYSLLVAGQELEIGALSIGNPHAVLRVPDARQADVEQLGPLIETHSNFPACRACAAVVYGISRGWLRDSVTVALPGGKLSVSWAGEGHPVIMIGPTAVVFDGAIKI